VKVVGYAFLPPDSHRLSFASLPGAPQQIDEAAEGGPHLAPDDQQIGASMEMSLSNQSSSLPSSGISVLVTSESA